MERFTKIILNIDNFLIEYFKWWKDNITAKITTKDKIFTIQKFSHTPSLASLELIEKIIHHLRWKNTILAQNIFDKRFFEYEGCIYQVMEYLDWDVPGEDDINLDKILGIARFLANFHREVRDFDYSIYERKYINNYKNLDHILEESDVLSQKYKEYRYLYDEMISRYNFIASNSGNLRKSVIHGDPSFKNFLFNWNKVKWLFDYNKISVDYMIRDIVDSIRSFLKLDWFGKVEYEIFLKTYDEINPLTPEEKASMKDYLKKMITITTNDYILSLFPENDLFHNTLWDKGDSIEKAKRCFKEFDKVWGF